MSAANELTYALPGSERVPLPVADPTAVPAQPQNALNPTDVVQATVRIRGKAEPPLPDCLGAQFPGERRYLNHDELEDMYGADPESLQRFLKYAEEQGLECEPHAGSRLVRCIATVEQFEAAFGVHLTNYHCPLRKRTYRCRDGSVLLPRWLAGDVTGVFGLDNRPAVVSPHGAEQAVSSMPIVNVADVIRAYRFPEESDGSDQAIAFLEFDAGYFEADLEWHFKKVEANRPALEAVLVYDGRNMALPDPNAPDPSEPKPDPNVGEPMLSMSIVGAAAPGAKHVVYFAPSEDAGVLQAFAAAIYDRVHTPSVISMSWGFLERDLTPQYVQALEQLLRSAALLGITVVAATGNHGSRMGQSDLHVTYPASSPCVLACGASRILDFQACSLQEVAWNDNHGKSSAGGLSRRFSTTPMWQLRYGPRLVAGEPVSSGRHVPDVTGHSQDYGFYFEGRHDPARMGGTSAVAPLWAALVARLNGALGVRVGFLNPLLYSAAAAGLFQDITEGTNGDFVAGEGWDACSGLGSPNGERLLHYLRAGCVG